MFSIMKISLLIYIFYKETSPRVIPYKNFYWFISKSCHGFKCKVGGNIQRATSISCPVRGRKDRIPIDASRMSALSTYPSSIREFDCDSGDATSDPYAKGRSSQLPYACYSTFCRRDTMYFFPLLTTFVTFCSLPLSLSSVFYTTHL
jgi:hypothetical protein